jgi:hypothetical protein
MKAHANSTQPTERSYPKEEAVITFESNSSKFSTSTLHPWHRRGLFSMLAVVIALVLASATVPADAQDGSFNTQQLGQALTSYGKNTVNNNGRTYYTVVCRKGPWKSNVTISLSPNGKVIWMAIEPTQMPDRISAAALTTILKKNLELGPMFFSVDGNWLRLSYPVPNNDMSEAKVKAFLAALLTTVADTMPLWDQRTLEGN